MKGNKLSEIVEEYRTKNNLSLREFADKVGRSKTFIWAIENSNKNMNPSYKTLQLLATGMNMDLEDLINRINGVFTDDKKFLSKKIEESENLTFLVRKLINLNDDDLQSVIKFIDSL